MLIRRIARPLLSAAIAAEAVSALRDVKGRAEHAGPVIKASQDHLPSGVSSKLPENPETLVRTNAALQLGGGVLLALGRAPRLTSMALSGSIIPTTVNNYAFWEESDPTIRAAKRTAFLKNLGLFGGLLLASVDTEGKPSVGWRARRAARRVRRAAPGLRSNSADGLSEGLHRTAEHGRDLAAAAGEGGKRLVEVTREEAPAVAEAAKERGRKVAEFVSEHGGELAEATKTAVTDLRAQALS